MIISITITGKRPAVEGEPVLVCGNSSDLVEFTFDAEWDDLAEKTARFIWYAAGEFQHVDVPIVEGRAAVPVLHGTREVQIGVFGGDLKATTPARIPCDYSVRCLT